MASSIINTFSVNLNCVVVVDLTWSGLLPTLIIITLTHGGDYLHFAEMLARSSFQQCIHVSRLLVVIVVIVGRLLKQSMEHYWTAWDKQVARNSFMARDTCRRHDLIRFSTTVGGGGPYGDLQPLWYLYYVL